ncbi:MAG: ATP-binding protein [Planctomycetota bacterium]|jgi:hypothetical protein
MGNEDRPFQDRTEEIELVENLLSSLREGNRTHLCFSGIPGAGKTSIVTRYIETRGEAWGEEGVILVHLPIGAFGKTVIDFCLQYVPNIAAAFLEAMGAKAQAQRLLSEEQFPDEARRLQSESLRRSSVRPCSFRKPSRWKRTFGSFSSSTISICSTGIACPRAAGPSTSCRR